MRTLSRSRGARAPLALATLAASLAVAPGPSPAAGQENSRRVPSRAVAPADLPGPYDDVTFRPTVMVRNGNARGSGTIIASTKGRSLVLTASHVVDGPGRAAIELHRYNLGIEGRDLGGRWPKVVPARIVAADPDADVAVLLVEGLARLPHVARLDDRLAEPPAAGSLVTSVGIDGASDINSWVSTIRGTAVLSRNRAEEAALPVVPATPDGGGGGPPSSSRLFLVTEHPPVQGRSGGGLYSSDGRLLGVCVGRIELERTGDERRAVGLFASGRSILGVLEQLDRPATPPK